jgi:AcrR family transcriptional regulator
VSAHGAHADGGPDSTRNRIMYQASNLFARRGYHATTTRLIAAAVGVRQPSLFYHFSSKQAILQALLDSDLDEALPFVEAIARQPQPAAVRLYRYLRHDVSHLTDAPFNLSGIYTEEVMEDPAFAPWARKRARLHSAVERIVREGIRSGEFVEMDSALVREAIAGILVRTLTLYSGGRRGAGPDLGDEIASLILRGLLRDPSVLEGLRPAPAGQEGG